MDFKISPGVPRAPTTKIYLSMEDVSDNQRIIDILAPIKFEYPRGVFHDMTARLLKKSYVSIPRDTPIIQEPLPKQVEEDEDDWDLIPK